MIVHPANERATHAQAVKDMRCHRVGRWQDQSCPTPPEPMRDRAHKRSAPPLYRCAIKPNIHAAPGRSSRRPTRAATCPTPAPPSHDGTCSCPHPHVQRSQGGGGHPEDMTAFVHICGVYKMLRRKAAAAGRGVPPRTDMVRAMWGVRRGQRGVGGAQTGRPIVRMGRTWQEKTLSHNNACSVHSGT